MSRMGHELIGIGGQAFLIVVIGKNGRQEKHPHAKAQRRKGAEMKNIKKTMTTNLSFLKK